MYREVVHFEWLRLFNNRGLLWVPILNSGVMGSQISNKNSMFGNMEISIRTKDGIPSCRGPTPMHWYWCQFLVSVAIIDPIRFPSWEGRGGHGILRFFRILVKICEINVQGYAGFIVSKKLQAIKGKKSKLGMQRFLVSWNLLEATQKLLLRRWCVLRTDNWIKKRCWLSPKLTKNYVSYIVWRRYHGDKNQGFFGSRKVIGIPNSSVAWLA